MRFKHGVFTLLILASTSLLNNNLIFASDISSNHYKIAQKIPILDPTSMIYDPANNNLYVLDALAVPNEPDGKAYGVNGVSVYHNGKEIANITPALGGSQQDNIAVNYSSGYVYTPGSDRVFVINGTQLLQSIDWHSLGNNNHSNIQPTSITCDSATGNVYVSNSIDGTINRKSEIDLFDKKGSYIKIIHLKDPVRIEAMAYDSKNQELYVADHDYVKHDDGIDIIKGSRIIKRIEIPYKNGYLGGTMIYDSDNGLIYALEIVPYPMNGKLESSADFAVIKNNQIVDHIQLEKKSGGGWNQISYNKNDVFINGLSENTIHIIHNYSLVSNIPISRPNSAGPIDVTCNTKTGQIYSLVSTWNPGSKSFLYVLNP